MRCLQILQVLAALQVIAVADTIALLAGGRNRGWDLGSLRRRSGYTKHQESY